MPDPTPYVAGGIEVAAGSALTVQIPPRVFLGRLTGLLFDTDKTFLLPRSLTGIRGLKRFYDAHPGAQVLVVGHTDTVGAAQYNLTLSIERARSIEAYLEDDVATWLEYYPGRAGSAHWGTVEDQQMLKELGFHSGEITGNAADSREAVRQFQTSKGLNPDGQAGQNTRRALVTAYMQIEGTTLPAGTVVKTHGCGKFHLEVPTADNVDEQRNRRVEVFFFESRVDPPPQARCPAPGCPEYREWRRRTVQTFNLEHPPGALDVTVQDPQGRSLESALVHASGPTVADGRTDAAGRVRFSDLIPGSYTVLGQRQGFRDGTAQVQVVEQVPSRAAAGASTGTGTAAATPGGSVNANVVLQPATVDLVVTVVSSTGASLSGATINVDGPLSTTGTSDANGVFTFRLPPGSHQVAASLDNFISPPAVAANVVANSSNGVTLTLAPNNVVATLGGMPLVVVLPKHNCTPARKPIRLGVTGAFTGAGKLRRSSNKVRFFTALTGGTEITFNGTDDVFTGAQLTAGVSLFAVGDSVSAAQEDVELRLELLVGQNPFGTPVAGKATCVDLTIDLFQSRPAPASDPAPMAVNDKTDLGRFVHLQDPGHHHRRAWLVVREVKPAGFAQDLELRAIAGAGGAVQLFPAEDHAAGESPIGLPHSLTAAELASAPQVAGKKGLAFFAEGQTVSSALRSVVLQLGIRGVEPDGDRAAFTVVRLSNLSLTIPSTDANTLRMGNGGLPASSLKLGTGAAPTAREHDESFVGNPPVVLVEGSIAPGSPIVLGVDVAPAGVPVRLSAQRVTNAADADNAAIRSSLIPAPAAQPTLTQSGAVGTAPIRGNLLADSVGSFHLRAFVDGNGSGSFEDRGEPFIVMNCVLVRVQGSTNSSASVNTNWGFGPSGGGTTPGFSASASTGLRLATGAFTSAAVAATHNDAVVNLIGGGPSGLVGLDAVFLGWVNNELDAATGTRPNASGEDVVSNYADPAPPGAVHRRISVMTSPGGQFFPPGGAAPALIAGPVLDTTNFGNEGRGGNRCVGTEGAVGPPIVHPLAAPVGTPGGVGKSRRVEMWDSPGDNCPPSMASFPAAVLTSYRFNIDFRSDLVAWTNGVAKAPAPSPGLVAAGSPAPDPACALYATVQTNRWTIRFSFNFGAAPAPVPNGSVTMARDPSATRIAVPIARPSTEVRFPIALSLLSVQELP